MSKIQDTTGLPVWQIAAVALLAATIVIGGAWFYRAQENHMCRAVENDLLSIAKLKVTQIVRWKTERLADAATLSENPLF